MKQNDDKDAVSNFDCDFICRFHEMMNGQVFANGEVPAAVAVAVSGGADSMSLCYALSEFFLSSGANTHIYAISVDHALRPEAADEVVFVGNELKCCSNISHHTLVWEYGEKPTSRVQEKARSARYDLLYGFMKENGVKHLFIGHHRNDQAETFLYRLAKGSGLDGLACMPVKSAETEDGIILCRPLLCEDKAGIVEYMESMGKAYIEDPSNDDFHYARVRIRKSMDVLSEEGLTPKRVYNTAMRLRRAKDALEYIAEKQYKNAILGKDAFCIVLKSNEVINEPLEIVIRVMSLAIEDLQIGDYDYAPRLERIEILCEDLVKPKMFRKRTLRGIIFDYNLNKGIITLSLEKNNREVI